MKFTQILHKIHIGKAIRYVWQHQRERAIIVTDAEKVLQSMGFKVHDPKEILAQPKPNPLFKFETDDNSSKANNTYIDCEKKYCLTFEDHNVLQEGISQACLLTNTVHVDNNLPQKVEELVTDIPNTINDIVKRIVYTSTIYDSQQVKLPRLKDPERPAWIFPRAYGICSTRKMLNLTKNFMQLCETLNGLNITQYRSVVRNGLFRVSIDKECDLIQFSLKMDLMMTSSMPLSPIATVNSYNELDMPSLHPLHHCIGLHESDIWKHDMYPINTKTPVMNVHTILINYDPEEVKNITELPVTENQIYARSLIKSFTAAASCARQKFGANVKNLPEPVVVQCIQSDGQNFHFSVYQLNTLDVDNENIRNFWWSKPFIKLYETAQYKDGQPCIEGYSSEVFKRFLAFYKNK